MNILNKQSWTTDMGVVCQLGIRQGAGNSTVNI
jgi:hypothetical protein